MAIPKPLSDAGWKDVVAKNKIKDNGLLKILEKYKRLGEDKPDDSLEALDEILKLAGQLKKDKAVGAVPVVGKYIAEIIGTAESAIKDVAKAKAEADKAAKAKAEAEKKAAEAAKKNDDDDEEEESPELLTTKLKPLLRLVSKGETMHTLVAKSGKQVVVMLSRKPIAPARRKMLAEQLGGGSTKYYPGICRLEAGVTTFALKAEVAGMAKLIKLALLTQTGLRVPKVKCRGEDGDDDDEDDGDETRDMVVEIDDEDDQEGQQATKKRAGPDDDVPRFVPGVEIDEPKAQLAQAPQVWNGAREVLESGIKELKAAIQAQLAGESDGFVKEVTANMAKIDRITGKLDRRLADTLADAAQAGDAQGREGELQIARTILAEYIRYVSSEPLIEHLDRNPFGVATNFQATLTKSLNELARTLG